MNVKDRIMVLFGSFFWGLMLFWFFGSLWFFAFPVIGIAYVIVGGKHHD